MTAPKRSETLGDRVERAIESHADVPGEIAGAVEPPRKRIVRSAIWLAVTGISLYLVFPSSLMPMTSMSTAIMAALLAAIHAFIPSRISRERVPRAK